MKKLFSIQKKPILNNVLFKYSGNDIIKNYFGNGAKFGVNLTYFFEPELLGTAGALKNMEEFVTTSENFLVIYGDILTNQNLNLLEEKQLQSNSIVT